jgi:hypothetical protein
MKMHLNLSQNPNQSHESEAKITTEKKIFDNAVMLITLVVFHSVEKFSAHFFHVSHHHKIPTSSFSAATDAISAF